MTIKILTSVTMLVLASCVNSADADIYKCGTTFQQVPCNGTDTAKKDTVKLDKVNSSVVDPNLKIVKQLKAENDASEKKSLINQQIVFQNQDKSNNVKQLIADNEAYKQADQWVNITKNSTFSVAVFKDALNARSKAFNNKANTQHKISENDKTTAHLESEYDKVEIK